MRAPMTRLPHLASGEQPEWLPRTICAMTYPKRLLTEGEEIVRDFRPHWRLLVIPFFWTLLFGAAIWLTWSLDPANDAFDWAVTALAAVLFVRFGFYPFISWWFTHYVLTNERLIRRSGVLARKGVEIPLENINDVSFSQTILERVLRSGDLLIESAGTQGQSRFGDIPEPEAFQSLIYKTREMRARDLTKGGGVEQTDNLSQLERYAALLKEGLITQEEFDAKKADLLGGE
jgi:uncharacterized membrane protein YdbT with pleckstrin-like domain